MDRTLWTIGHSNHSWERFVQLLRQHGIESLADVRRFPGSRAHPQFGRDVMQTALQDQEEISYLHIEALGGRRRRLARSVNTAWRVASFNAYADYTASEQFEQGLQSLVEIARRKRTAMMCSEALPWRCHRRIIADVLVARGWNVLHIIGSKATAHVVPEFAQIRGERVCYPGGTLF